mmetsp:Transcript_20/g.19  ORF Transcript_20/g.19 Transcript_20/m.19 type:complete len:514 (-) Transcript_20:304-1845(-)
MPKKAETKTINLDKLPRLETKEEPISRSASLEIRRNATLSTIHSLALDLEKMEILQQERICRESSPYWVRLAIKTSLPDTSPNELIRRSAFMLMSSLTCGAGLVWASMYFYLGEPNAAVYPTLYSVLMATCFAILSKEGRYEDIVFVQLLLILILPVCLQFEVGGIVKAGGVIIWSFLCPLGAALFCKPKDAQLWFAVYLSLMIVTITAEFWHVKFFSARSARALDPIEVALFVMNICGAMTITFVGAQSFSTRLHHEYNRSEKLLHNVLPRSIIKRLKAGENQIIEHFEGAIIMFADLVGFTLAASEFHPKFLIGMFLRDVFSEWDKMCDARSMEKIKTIGDAYMAVGGIEHVEYQGPHVVNQMISLGLDFQIALDRINKRYHMNFSVRIGIHAGPVIAGVIGVRKFAFDVWGDAVNTASRMESHGIPGHIQISSDTYEKIKDCLCHLNIDCRGQIDVKGKGRMTTYLIKLPFEPVKSPTGSTDSLSESEPEVDSDAESLGSKKLITSKKEQ